MPAGPGRHMFATKDALVIMLDRCDGAPTTPFAFYVDNDDEKLAFVGWFINYYRSGGFADLVNFTAHITALPNNRPAVYFEADGDDEKNECLFPIADDSDKLALFECIAAGELEKIYQRNGRGVYIKLVKAKVPFAAGAASAALQTPLPKALADKIVDQLADGP